jgi:hypothetical protein
MAATKERKETNKARKAAQRIKYHAEWKKWRPNRHRLQHN